MSRIFYLFAGVLLLSCSAVLADEITLDRPWPHADRGIGPVTVGPDGNCDFPTVSAGVANQLDGGDVRVMSGTYNLGAQLVLSKNIRLIGGYPDCFANSTPSGRSTLNRGGSGLVLDIFYSADFGAPIRQVEVENFVITGGGGSGLFSGGAVVEGRPGRLVVNFRNVEFSNNSRTGTGGNGGGLRVITTGNRDGESTFVTLDNDSRVANNSASSDGGGIYCQSVHDQGTGTILRIGSTLVFDNSATNGGGIALDGCKNTFLYNGGPIVLIFPAGGIINNTATEDGGGLYLVNGAEAELRGIPSGVFGEPEDAALIAGNTADIGGGAYVEGTNTSLLVEDAYVINNTAFIGGGFHAANNAALMVGKNTFPGRCEPPFSGGGVFTRPRCSVIEGNDGRGGAVSAFATSNVEIYRTTIRENTVLDGSTGTIARLLSGAQIRFEGVVFDGNTGGFGLDVQDGSTADIMFSTIVNNDGTIGRARASAGQTTTINILSSIIEKPFGDFFQTEGSGDSVIRYDCVLSDRSTSDWGATSVNQSTGERDPLFIDPASGDYRLSDRSPAIDYCDDSNLPQYTGLDGEGRGFAWTGPGPFVPPTGAVNGGNYDIGAHEMVFEPRIADLELEIVEADTFVNANQTDVAFALRVINNGPDVAFSVIDVIDEVMPSSALTNRSWTCFLIGSPACTASGNGPVAADIFGDLEPGEGVLIEVEADVVDTSVDSTFIYAGSVVGDAVFNVDPNLSNDTDMVEVRIDLFADGFESPPVLP